MAKIQILLLVVAVLPAIFGYPFEESEPSSPTKDSDKLDTLDHKEVPKNDSSEGSYVEETYIEVLLPGVPKLNSTILESVLNESIANDTADANRPKRDSSDEEDDSSEEERNKKSNTSTATPVLYSQRRVRRDVSSKDPKSSSTAIPKSTKAPLYSHKVKRDDSYSLETSSSSSSKSSTSSTTAATVYAQNVKRGISDEDSKSNSTYDHKYSLPAATLDANSTGLATAYSQSRPIRDAESTSTVPSSSTQKPVLYSGHVKRGVNDGGDSTSSSSTSRAVPGLYSQTGIEDKNSTGASTSYLRNY